VLNTVAVASAAPVPDTIAVAVTPACVTVCVTVLAGSVVTIAEGDPFGPVVVTVETAPACVMVSVTIIPG